MKEMSWDEYYASFYDQKFATRVVEKALAAGVQFTPDHVLEITLLIEKPVLSKMAEGMLAGRIPEVGVWFCQCPSVQTKLSKAVEGKGAD